MATASTYAQLRKEIEAMEKKAEEAKKAEVKEAIGKVRAIVKLYELTPHDCGFFGWVKTEPKRAAIPTQPRYQDPATGRTWTGHGKPPNWIRQSGKPKEDFLIAGGRDSTPATSSKRAAPGTRRTTTATKKLGRTGAGAKSSAKARSQTAKATRAQNNAGRASRGAARKPSAAPPT